MEGVPSGCKMIETCFMTKSEGGIIMKRDKKIFAICDLEEAYVVHLADYLNQKGDLPFRVMAFTKLESLIEYAQGNEIEILLISTDAMNDEVRELDVHRIIILSDGEKPNLENGDLFIDKYQDSDTIARLVCGYAGQACAQMKESLGDCRLIGVYSPISRCGKTLFSLTLADACAQEERTVYINLESCSGFEGLLKTAWREDLADLMFVARSERESFQTRLESILTSYGNLDICPPSFFPEDLRDIDVREWMQFFASVSQALSCHTIVLDIGPQIKDIPELLKMCGAVFMPILPDPVSRAKVSQFEKNLQALSMEDLKRSIIRLYLPSVSVHSLGASLLDDLLYGNMGQFVRRLLDEEGI